MSIIKSLFSIFWSFFKIPIIIILVCICLFYFSCFVFFVISLIKGNRLKKGSRKRLKKRNIFIRIFVDFPKQVVDDFFKRDPDFFQPQGLVIFEGRQGSGKTSSMIEYCLRLQKEYPKLKVTTNLAYTKEDVPLEDWRFLMTYKNDIFGVVVLMDELQNWFSSNDSRNFPPDMLQIITQNRKNRRLIMGTAQNFYLLSKPIRTQCTEVRRCMTILGCLTFVRRFEPVLDASGDVVEFKYRGMYFFVHNKELRESYDTYKIIERLAKVGFKEENPKEDNEVKINVVSKPVKKRKRWF